ncbi:hypothetical protein [Paenibacillus taichungensis]|uniref:hypothetical protein n=1 Tax=Paenibacillus taichungensis TaxID=484184 RepID=UPI0039A5AF66
MIAVVLFAVLYILEWPMIKSSKKGMKRTYFVLLGIFLLWNTLAVSVPSWPNPNDVIRLVFGWADRLFG